LPCPQLPAQSAGSLSDAPRHWPQRLRPPRAAQPLDLNALGIICLEIDGALSRCQYLAECSLIPLRYHQREKSPTSGLGRIRAQTATASNILLNSDQTSRRHRTRREYRVHFGVEDRSVRRSHRTSHQGAAIRRNCTARVSAKPPSADRSILPITHSVKVDTRKLLPLTFQGSAL
jgi:hypothetical protein